MSHEPNDLFGAGPLQQPGRPGKKRLSQKRWRGNEDHPYEAGAFAGQRPGIKMNGWPGIRHFVDEIAAKSQASFHPSSPRRLA